MGGRGASSGISVKGKKYGSEYYSIYKSGNIKFLISNAKSTNTPMETMTNGRIYVTVDKNQNKLKSITYYDKKGKRKKQIDLAQKHYIDGKLVVPHTHKGYFHNEKGDYIPTSKEQKMIDRVNRIWDNYQKRKK